MAFHNRIRLPFYVSRPQFPAERSTYRKADGTAKTLSVDIRKTYQGLTDYLPELWHQRLIVALSHDEVTIENDRYIGGVALDGEYEIDWQTFQDYPVAQANFQVQVTPFLAQNSNCQTCEQANQLNLEDDTVPGDPIGDGGSGSVNVLDNDSVCCYPPTLSIIYTNEDYITNAALADDGEFTFDAVAEVPVQENVRIATYRVTCPDGSYDEADIFASFNGSGGVVCCEPYGIVLNESDIISWQADCAPANGFHIDFRLASDPGTVIWELDTPFKIRLLPPIVTDNPGNYIFTVKSLCEDGEESNSATFEFTIGEPVSECYGFDAIYGLPGAPTYATFTYMRCDGEIISFSIPPLVPTRVCAAIHPGTDPQIPIYWAADKTETSFVPMAACGGAYQSSAAHDIEIAAVCPAPYVDVWIVGGTAIDTGVTVYLDAGLTTPVPTGYIKDVGGNIFTITSGLVDINTGTSC